LTDDGALVANQVRMREANVAAHLSSIQAAFHGTPLPARDRRIRIGAEDISASGGDSDSPPRRIGFA